MIETKEIIVDAIYHYIYDTITKEYSIVEMKNIQTQKFYYEGKYSHSAFHCGNQTVMKLKNLHKSHGKYTMWSLEGDEMDEFKKMVDQKLYEKKLHEEREWDRRRKDITNFLCQPLKAMENPEEEKFREERRNAFKVLSKHVEEFMNEYATPHDTLIATQSSIELLNGDMALPLKVND